MTNNLRQNLSITKKDIKTLITNSNKNKCRLLMIRSIQIMRLCHSFHQTLATSMGTKVNYSMKLMHKNNKIKQNWIIRIICRMILRIICTMFMANDSILMAILMIISTKIIILSLLMHLIIQVIKEIKLERLNRQVMRISIIWMSRMARLMEIKPPMETRRITIIRTWLRNSQ